MMRCLLDTNILLWFLDDSQKLPAAFKETLISDNNELFISIASLWEITIKSSIGKLVLKSGLKDFFSIINGSGQFSILPVQPSHLIKLHSLEFKHNDPFDRLIIAQALSENMKLLYTDSHFSLYKSFGNNLL